MNRFTTTLEQHSAILAEGAVIERLRRRPGIRLDEHVLHAGFLYRQPEMEILAGIYREYLAIGREASLPLVLLTPTWKASFERLERAGLGGRDVNGDAVRFLADLRSECGAYAGRVLIGGLVGPRGDAYRPGETLSEREARRYHAPQLEALARGGADFLLASTLPAAPEARGLTRAMVATGRPSVLSFIIDRTARLLDGTPLESLIAELDAGPRPAGYLVNCVHHSAMGAALEQISPGARQRLLGFQANTSAKDPEELDGLDYLDAGSPEVFAEALYGLHRDFGLRILGGCCGSDGRHIRHLAQRLARPAAV